MFGQRPMAGLAVDLCMCAGLFLFQDIAVTDFAGLMTGKPGRMRRNLRNRVPTVMPILPKALRNKKSACQKEKQSPEDKDRGKAEKMSGMPEIAHMLLPEGICHPQGKSCCAADLALYVRQITIMILVNDDHVILRTASGRYCNRDFVISPLVPKEWIFDDILYLI
jgi:hypothetical protein